MVGWRKMAHGSNVNSYKLNQRYALQKDMKPAKRTTRRTTTDDKEETTTDGNSDESPTKKIKTSGGTVARIRSAYPRTRRTRAGNTITEHSTICELEAGALE